MDSSTLKNWTRLLLDVGKRNNLVNFKDLPKSTVEVLLPEVDVLFNKADTEYTIPVYDPQLESQEKSNPAVPPLPLDLEKRTPKQKREKYLERYALAARKKLLVYNGGDPIEAIENLEKKARFFFEETGLHVSYMVFGFIRWGEFNPNETSTPPNKAPLLLAPINIEWDRTQGSYVVRFTGDDPFLNPTFAFKMESEFGIVLPEYNNEPFYEYLQKVKDLVENDKYKQRVFPECKIGLFSFQKINMYRDLTDNAVTILAHENVRRLLDKAPEPSDQPVTQRLANPLIELQNVVDADSSQLEAIEKARAGVSFVLQGPPGTGKSQTITNIVAELLGQGKKVLFVSEKQAALNVVYDKLCKAGLGEFCLELHSHKANKKEVVAELCKTLRTPKSGVSSRADQEIHLKESTMRQLDAYVDELHKPRPIVEKSLYELYQDYSSLRNAPIVNWTIPNLSSFDDGTLQNVLLLLKEYAAYVPLVGEDYRQNPWHGLQKRNASFQNKRELQNTIDALWQLVTEIKNPLEEASRLYGLDVVNLLESYNVALLFELLSIPNEIGAPLLDASKRNLVVRSIRVLDAQSADIKTSQASLDALFDERVFSLNGKEYRERLVQLYDGVFYRLLKNETSASKNNAPLRDAVDALLRLVDEIRESLDELARLYDIRCATLVDVYNLYHIFPILSKTKALGPKFLNASTIERVADELAEIDDQRINIQKSQSAIDALFDKEIYDIDGKDSRLRLVRLYSGFFTRLFNGEYKSFSKKLRLYKRDGKKLSYQEEIDAMEKLELFQENTAAFETRVLSLGNFVAPSALENNDSRKALREALDQLVKFVGRQTPLGRLPQMSDQEFEEEHATLERIASSLEVAFTKYAAHITLASKNFKLSSFKIQNAVPWYREFADALDLYLRDGKKLSYYEQIDAMEKLEQYQKNVEQFNAYADSLDTLVCPPLLKNDDARRSLKTSLEKLSLLCDQNVPLGRLLNLNSVELERERVKFARLADALGKAFQKSDSVIFRAENYFDRANLDVQRDPREKVERRCAACRESLNVHVNALEEWIHFETQILPRLDAQNLLSFIDVVISSRLPCQEVPDAFQRLCREEQIVSIIASTPELARFSQISQDQTVQIFREKDAAQFMVNKARLRAFLSSQRPASEFAVPGSEVHILLREGEKKRKQKSIRVLLSEISDLALLLKPCFLMSPLSVSTFLAGDSLHFDTVIFDEASQIFPQDALGAIYRADQLIVVGDSKQMPPSNFFNASNDSDFEEEEDDESGKYESILDLCAGSLPVQRLSWHYRSRHESLIAFSNKNFYESRLVTFPSTQSRKEDVGINYYCVDGTFDRKLRHNYKETSFIVDLIYQHIKETPERSLGIVAFSQSQQKLIERLLKQRRLREQDKADFFRPDVPEPFFVKNLETVQGDERDTIIFSIAYAKGSDGKFLHNFGPLNRQQGERRLNVAVTRAKLNVKVVASIHGSDINLDQAKSHGARLLREYLEYAETGICAFSGETNQGELYESPDDFVDEVYETLVEKGYQVDKHVGASELKIDLAVKAPDTDDYFFAIECDGDAYRRSKNARDRDRLRQEVLKGTGWSYYRLWSTEWFKNRGRSLERLLQAINRTLSTHSHVSVKTPPSEPSVFDIADDDLGVSFEEKVDGSADNHFPRYRAANVDAIISSFPKDLQKIVHAILEVEAPLSEEILIKRIVSYFGREKVTNAVLHAYEEQMQGHQRHGIYRQNGFLYLETSRPLSLRSPGDLKRNVVQIAPQEIAAGMMQLIQQNVSLEKSALFQGVLRICEARMSQGVRERLEAALQFLGNRVVVEGERVSIPQ